MSNAPLVLVVDDEVAIRRLLSATLARADYRVIEAGSAAEALALLPSDPAVVLLDLGLPDRDGLELVPLILKLSKAAILVVSARDATDEKVAALDLGAIDYVTKPFDTEELLARVRAALRNRIASEGGQAEILAGDVRIDLVNYRIRKGGEEVHLTPKEYGVIAELAKFPGRVITHDRLLKAVWANEYDPHVEYLRVVVRNIRQKLENDPARPMLIRNEPGVGYRLAMGAL